MSFGGNKEKMVVCPVNKGHMIRSDRYLFHVVKCIHSKGEKTVRIGPEQVAVGQPKDAGHRIHYLTKEEKMQQHSDLLMEFKKSHPEFDEKSETKETDIEEKEKDLKVLWSDALLDTPNTELMDNVQKIADFKMDFEQATPSYVATNCTVPLIPVKLYNSTIPVLSENVYINDHCDQAGVSFQQDSVLVNSKTDFGNDVSKPRIC